VAVASAGAGAGAGAASVVGALVQPRARVVESSNDASADFIMRGR
jgi:hypothetical protein